LKIEDSRQQKDGRIEVHFGINWVENSDRAGGRIRVEVGLMTKKV
jgi:hypothetical protein